MNKGFVGILLAAGQSTRFGENKLHKEIEPATPLALYAARKLATVMPDCVAVVHPDDELLPDIFAHAGLRVVINPHANSGIGTSLATGLASSPNAAGWVIALADMPLIPQTVIQQVATALRLKEKIIVPVYRGKRGHPVGIPQLFGRELQTLSGDVGARDLMQKHPAWVSILEVADKGIIRDIDTRTDFDKLSAVLNSTDHS